MNITLSIVLLASRSPVARFLLISLCLGLATGPVTEVRAELWEAEAPLFDDGRYPVGTLVFSLDQDALRALLDRAPADRSSGAMPVIELPLPDGTWESFSFHRARVMHPDLEAKYPEIRTFVGIGRNTRWGVRFELTQHGFSASVRSPNGGSVIESAGGDRYASVRLSDVLARDPEPFRCDVEADPEAEREIEELVNRMEWSRGGGVANGDLLRTYEVAIAATGEYTAQNGGTVSGGLAAIGVAVNRFNEVMGVDWSVTLQLVPNNDLIVYTDPLTDPYTNGDIEAMINENQSNLDAVIGNANYDFGHVFGTAPGGGRASTGSVCVSPLKGKAVTTWSYTYRERFIRIAAHEMGHQFGAHHTFNGDEGACLNNRVAISAYEPGSGSTLMGYGEELCGDQTLQDMIDFYYHVRTYGQVIANITSGNASSCPTVTPTGNTPPVALVETNGYFIPLDTPFQMNGSGTDADGDSLTYCWEEYDLGPAGHPDYPEGTAPIFRSRGPTAVSSRILPRLNRVLNNDHRIGELLPTYQRRIRWRLTVRDGRGGVHWDQGRVWADSTAGPFLITSQNTSETLSGGQQITVIWDVANTNNPDVNCQTVNILLSEDRRNYDHVLAAATPNDGSEMVTVPMVETTTARIRVEAADNVFFDLNDADLTITSGTGVEALVSSALSARLEPARPNPFLERTSLSYTLPTADHVTLRVFDPAGRLVRILFDGPVSSGRHSVKWDGTNRSGAAVASGIYFVRLETERCPIRMQKLHLVR
jgi:hypothetical protein